MNTEKTILSLLKRIKQHQNAEVARAMNRNGIYYDTNYGVSLPDLKKIASECEPSHELALRLRVAGNRELLFLSVLLDQPEKLDKDQLSTLVDLLPTEELIDFAMMNLVVKTSCSRLICREWINDRRPHFIYAGLVLLMRIAQHDKKPDTHWYLSFSDLIENLAAHPNLQVRKAVSKTLRQIGSINNETKDIVLRCAGRLRKSSEIYSQQTGCEVKNDLELE